MRERHSVTYILTKACRKDWMHNCTFFDTSRRFPCALGSLGVSTGAGGALLLAVVVAESTSGENICNTKNARTNQQYAVYAVGVQGSCSEHDQYQFNENDVEF